MSEAPQSDPVKVVYVMGAGHSGSTILGVTLGNCEGFVYAGEVEEWLVKSGRPPWADGERTRFWNGVAERVDGEELFGAGVNRLIERSSAALRVDRWPQRRRRLAAYRRIAADLFRAISDTAGAEHVVDTSHFPLRARELKKIAGIELFLIFLVREPAEVVESNLRELSQHEVAERRVRTLRLNAELWLTQLASVLVFVRAPRERRLFLRHEDFLAEPELALRQILDMVGSAAPLPDLGALRIGYPLEGNRLIRGETIALKRSSGRAPRRLRGSLLTMLAQLPWRPILARMRPAAAAPTRTPPT